MAERKTVFVGLSGGVDSSVAAHRLLKAGHQVVGVFVKVWHPDFLECNWEAERLDAMRVAASLDIPFLTCDAEAAYREKVGEYFVAEYQAGRTPNPDVMCNQHIKFGAFLDFALTNGADCIATGHYAQVKHINYHYSLLRGVDKAKDQSYFLWTLTQDQLQYVLFPVGNTPKDKIREEAETAGLLTFNKKDSQGICFLGHIDIPEFMSHFTDLSAGEVLNTNGETIGTHAGALVYTLGQRHGFELKTSSTAERPHYVVAKDVANNTITVNTKPPVIDEHEVIELSAINLIEGNALPQNVHIQFRYRQAPLEAEVISFGETIKLRPKAETIRPAKGQSCVLYQGHVCLGGGIIS